MDAVHLYGPDPLRVDVTMVSKDAWTDNNVDIHIGNTYIVRSGKKVIILKSFEDFKDIRIRRVPATWNKLSLERIFSFYGDIQSVEQEKMRPNDTNYIKPSWSHLKTGTYRIRMKVKRDIPSTLVVSRYKIEIYYYGQQQTCWVCGMGHYKGSNECPNDYRQFVNRFSMNDFPPLTKTTTATTPVQPITTDQVKAQRAGNQQARSNAGEAGENYFVDASGHTYNADAKKLKMFTTQRKLVQTFKLWKTILRKTTTMQFLKI